MGSFKIRLAAYFALIALLPFAAAFRGFHSLAERSETRRVDAVLQTSLRAVLAAYEDELLDAQRAARALAREPKLQRALATRDRKRLARLVRPLPNVRVEAARGLRVGPAPAPAATRVISVLGPTRPLGTVVAAVPIDRALARRLVARAGLTPSQRLVFAARAKIVAGSSTRGARLDVQPGRTGTVSVGSKRYRAVASEVLPEPPGMTLALLSPQGAIDRAAGSNQERLTVTMLIALVLLILIAYFEGRAIVRTLGRLVAAANDIARGRLDRRVEVRGRDEFARLGRAFNEMADQLQSRLSELEDERRRLRDATMRFGEALAATHNLDQLLRVVVETAVEATGAQAGILLDEDGEIVRKGDPAAGTERLRLPLKAGHESFGTLVLAGDGFTDEQAEMANWLVGHAVIALGNARLHRTVQRQALVDSLTGLANRRLCEAALEKEISRAQRFVEPLSLVLADLDDFKQVNDVHGHPTGDEVLCEFASALKESVRDIDLAARWGGEEFAIVLPETDRAGGIRLAERVRAALRKHVVVAPNGDRLSLTASFGVATFAGRGSATDLLAAADAALYEAKRAGKDRVSAAPDPGEPSVEAASVRA